MQPLFHNACTVLLATQLHTLSAWRATHKAYWQQQQQQSNANSLSAHTHTHNTHIHSLHSAVVVVKKYSKNAHQQSNVQFYSSHSNSVYKQRTTPATNYSTNTHTRNGCAYNTRSASSTRAPATLVLILELPLLLVLR